MHEDKETQTIFHLLQITNIKISFSLVVERTTVNCQVTGTIQVR